ncbi:hypothetical protein F0562_034774 [Nyssa sinensis]|uniref:Uncharacterized protein n=1 Tax=Nyssa sinensis TaxID=561372 RepID=A0A5J5AE77_9ASTE|nr:hypothetical protein F0562_034774 [Nyssa sinensis]
MNILMDNMWSNGPPNDTTDTGMRLFQRNMDCARDIIHQKFQERGDSPVHPGNLLLKGDCFNQSSENDMFSVFPLTNQLQDMETAEKGKLNATVGNKSTDRSEAISLLDREVVMNVDLTREKPMKSCRQWFFRIQS